MAYFAAFFCAALAAVYILRHLIRCATSPLWELPGPVGSRFTSGFLKWNELQGNRRMYIHRLHQRHGPVVRLSPNEVSFTSPGAVKEIYCSAGSGYDKTEFYNLFTIFGKRTMFTMLNREDHGTRKRLIADRYANRNIMRPPAVDGIQSRARRFAQACAESAGSRIDVFKYLHAYACDCVTHHLFHPYGSNCLGDDDDMRMMHQVASDDSLQNRLIYHYSPTLHSLVAGPLRLFAKPRETPLADQFVRQQTQRPDPASFTLLSRLNEKRSDLDDGDVAAECLDHMAAGIDTTGDALCFIMWQLSQPKSRPVQARLREEVRARPGASLDKLAYLDAVVMEGLRCFPAIPMSLPRYVPTGGRTLEGYYLPENTIVSCQAYSVHRLNEAVFPDPERFDPARWLASDGDAERRRLMFAFSSGGRGCVGKHLALLEMKALLRDVYSSLRTVPDPSMKACDMEMSDQLISSRPYGQKCLLRCIAAERGDD